MGIGYQKTDRKSFDYDIWFAPALPGLALRGPRPTAELSKCICFIGAAQTFGRFVNEPFAQLVCDLLRRPGLNLGFSGAGPEFYLGNDKLMSILSAAPAVVVQSMSARSVSAGLFETRANNGVLRFRSGPRAGQEHMALNAYGFLRKEGGEAAYLEQVGLVQARWVELYGELARRIRGRKVFLWLSEHAPGENVRLDQGDLGHFPHFVTREMVEAVRKFGFEVVDGTYGPMAPQVLRSDTTGLIEEVFDSRHFPGRREGTRSLNTYYTVPAAHRVAAMQLVRHFLASGPGEPGGKGP